MHLVDAVFALFFVHQIILFHTILHLFLLYVLSCCFIAYILCFKRFLVGVCVVLLLFSYTSIVVTAVTAALGL